MKIYYPDKQYGNYVVTEFSLGELWKRMDEISLIRFLKKCYLSKKKCQQFCDFENAPDMNLGGLEIKESVV